jgi:hypothetical protein
VVRHGVEQGPALTRRRAWVIGALLAVAGAGVVLRVWVYGKLIATPNADEAVVGLMTRHLLHGELTTFYWGQAYGGPQEVYLTVPLFWAFGQSWLALRLVPIALNAVACVLVWRVGRRTLGEPRATVAGALLWLWPPFTVVQLVHQNGFYGSNLVYPPLLLLLALRIAERPNVRRVALFGFVVGLAVWETSQIVPFLVGVIAWLVWKARGALRHLPAAAGAAILGGAPWVVWNLIHGFESLNQAKGSMPRESLRLLISPMLPMTIGLRAPFSGQLLIPSTAVTYLVYLLLGAAFAVGAVRLRNRPASLLFVTALLFPVLYVLAPYTAGVTGNPRYLTVIVPVLALLAAMPVRTAAAGGVLLAGATALSFVTLSRANAWFQETPHPTTQVRGLGARDVNMLVPRDLGPLIASLERLRVKHVYTDYWLAYRLDFDSHEQITATENRLIGMTFQGRQATPTLLHTRYEPYARAVAAAPHSFLFYRRLVASADVVPKLLAHGYRRHDLGTYVLLMPPG